MIGRRGMATMLVAVIAAGGCGGSAPKPAVDVGIKLRTDDMTLPNGLVVVMHREATERSVHVAVKYDVGSKNDPKGKAGLAHLFEHLMFKSPKHGGGRDYSEWLEEVGARPNAFTNRDETRYYESLSPDELARALWLEADRMAYPLAGVDEATLKRERDVVKNEWRERYENQPYGHVLASAFHEVFGADHPYALPTIGIPSELDTVTLDDLHAFAKAYYRPNNAALVVSGAFEPASVRALVTKYFATIPPGRPHLDRELLPVTLADSREVVMEADVPAPMVMMAWPAPRPHAAGWEPLTLGLTMFHRWVRHRLVAEKEIADEVHGQLVPGKLGSLVAVEVKGKQDASTSTIVGVLDEYLTTVSRAGSTARYGYSRFPDLKTGRLVSSVLELDAMDERADALLHGLAYHGKPDAVQEDLHAIGIVRLDEVAAAVEQFLSDAPRIVLVVKPTKGAPRAGRLLR